MCLLYKRKIKKVIQAAEEFRKRLEDEDLGLTGEKTDRNRRYDAGGGVHSRNEGHNGRYAEALEKLKP